MNHSPAIGLLSLHLQRGLAAISICMALVGTVAMPQSVHAQCILPPPPSGTVNVTITSDNAYVFGFGNSAAITSLFPGVDNCTSGDIYACSNIGAECYNVPASLNGYIYIVAWSDDNIYQGTIAQFTDANGTTIHTEQLPPLSPQWEVYATGDDRDPCPTSPIPDIPTLNSHIAIANGPVGGGAGTSNTWVNSTGTGPTAQVVGNGLLNFSATNASAPGAPFPPQTICNIDGAAQWIWYNPFPALITDPFVQGAHPNFPAAEMREYYIFRIGPLGVLLGSDTCVTAPDHMVAWWPLDEFFGPTAYDLADAPLNHGTHIGPPLAVPGKVGRALRFFPGASVQVPDATELNFGTAQDFSIDAWFKYINPMPLYRPIVDKRDPSGVAAGYHLYVNDQGFLQCVVQGLAIVSTSPLSPNLWYHVAATVERPVGITLYVNGVNVTAGPPLPTNTLNASSPGLDLLIGGTNNPNLATLLDTEYDIDEVEIFDSVLSSAQVNSLYLADSLGKCKCDTDTLAINTGYDHIAGAVYTPIGVSDGYWTVTCDPDNGTTEPRPAFTIAPHAGWQPAQAGSLWISSYPTSTDDLNGTYCFEYCFCLDSGFTNAVLDMNLRADDSARVYLNGNLIGATPASSFATPVPTHITTANQSFFSHEDMNCIEVEVENVFQVAMGLNVVGFVTADGISLEKGPCCDSAGQIQGMKWNDLNGDGIKTPNEPPLANWQISLTNGSVAVTDALGNYYFSGLAPGSYGVQEVLQAGWTQTFPGFAYQVNLNPRQVVSGVNFGNHRNCLIDVPGDVDLSGAITSADIIRLVNYVFKGGAAPLPCQANGDVNCNGVVTSADIITMVGFVFKGGAPPCDICSNSPLAAVCN